MAAARSYSFAGFRLSCDGPPEACLPGVLLKNDEPVALKAKPLQLLFLILQRAPYPVVQQDVLAFLWPGDRSGNLAERLYQHVCALRKVLGATLLDTSSNRYRLTVEVTVAPPPSSAYDALSAEEVYALGRWNWKGRTRESLVKATRCFDTGLRRPLPPETRALYLAGAADTLGVRWDLGLIPTHELEGVAALGKALSEEALNLAPYIPETRTARGFWLLHTEFEWKQAEAQYREAIRIAPQHATSRQWLALLLASAGRVDAATEQADQAVAADQQSPMLLVTQARMDFYGGRFLAASNRFDEIIGTYPTFLWAHVFKGEALDQLGRTREASEVLEHALTLSTPQEPRCIASLAHAYGKRGRRHQAQAKNLIQKLSSDHCPPALLAVAHMGLRDHDAALEHLAYSYEHQTCCLTNIAAEPRFQALRTIPRFRDLVVRVRPE